MKEVRKIITILQNIGANKFPAVPNKFTLAKSFRQVEFFLTNEKQLKSTGNNLKPHTIPNIQRFPRVEQALPPSKMNEQPPRVQDNSLDLRTFHKIMEPYIPKLPPMPQFPKAFYTSSRSNIKNHFKHYVNHIFNDSGTNINIDKLLADNQTYR